MGITTVSPHETTGRYNTQKLILNKLVFLALLMVEMFCTSENGEIT